MKIYFAGSIRGGRQDVHLYHEIITQLKGYGQVLTEFVGIDFQPESCQNPPDDKMDDKDIHARDMAMLQECDYLIAEVTQPSHGVGYEIGRAVAWNKPILCLFRPQDGKRLSAMISGAVNGTTFQVVSYQVVSEVPDILKKYFQQTPK